MLTTILRHSVRTEVWAATTIAATLMAKLVLGATRMMPPHLGNIVMSRDAVLLEIKLPIVDTKPKLARVTPVSLGRPRRHGLTDSAPQTSLLPVWAVTTIAATLIMTLTGPGVTRRTQPGNGPIVMLRRAKNGDEY
jgi:hypothetical protein